MKFQIITTALLVTSCLVGLRAQDAKFYGAEYEKECGNPLAENMSWKSFDGKVVEVLKGDAIIVLMANNERKHVSLAGVNSACSLAAKALLLNLILDRKSVCLLIRPTLPRRR